MRMWSPVHARDGERGHCIECYCRKRGGTQFGGVNGATAFFIYVSIATVKSGANSGNLTAFAVDSVNSRGRAMLAVALAHNFRVRTVNVPVRDRAMFGAS